MRETKGEMQWCSVEPTFFLIQVHMIHSWNLYAVIQNHTAIDQL